MSQGIFLGGIQQLNGSTIAKILTAAYGIGDVDNLFIHFDGQLSSTDGSQPTATINLWMATKQGSFGTFLYAVNAPLTADANRRKIWTGTLAGAAGGAATAESTDVFLGPNATGTGNIFIGSIIAVEVLMSANGLMGMYTLDIQGK